MSPDENLIYMANQIATFFSTQGEARAVAGIGDHIQKFWDPRMRSDLLRLARQEDSKLNPLVQKALPLIAGS
ncbi:MAG: formate dehydrogenase subunit delta [Rhizomicrobium sp.]